MCYNVSKSNLRDSEEITMQYKTVRGQASSKGLTWRTSKKLSRTVLKAWNGDCGPLQNQLGTLKAVPGIYGKVMAILNCHDRSKNKADAQRFEAVRETIEDVLLSN